MLGPCGWCVGLFFLCLHVFTAHGGWWVWVRFGLGIKRFSAAVWWWGGFQAHCRVSRSTPCERPLPCVGGGCLRSQLAVVVLLVWVVCGGLFVICIVVASIFVLYCFCVFV